MTDTNDVVHTAEVAHAADVDHALPYQGDGSPLHMLTTVDNPFDPFTEYRQWDAWDQDAGYYTAQFLARITITSDELSEADQDVAIENAIDEIVRENILGIYKKVQKV
jgi:hypothetical protein